MNEKLSWIGNVGGVLFTIVQTQQIFQIISLILTCVATLFSLGITLYNLYRKAKQGKFEVSDLEKAKEEIEKLKEEIEKYQKEEE